MAIADLPEDIAAPVPSPDRRAQAMQRLQVGGIGLVAILMVMGVASVVIERAQAVEETAVSEAKLKTPDATETTASDPLAEIGVVPSPEPAPTTPAPSPTSAATTGNVAPVPQQ